MAGFQRSHDVHASREADEEEDSVQVLLCGTSDEGTITDFAREQQRSGGPPAFAPFSPPHAGPGEALPPVEADDAFDANLGQETPFSSALGDAAAQRHATDGACVGENIEGILECAEDAAGGAGALLSSLSGQQALASSHSFPLLRHPTESLESAHATGEKTEGAEAVKGVASLPRGSQTHAGVPDVEAATAEGKVVMEWEVSRDRKWLYARDKSQWFNYGFDETTFREWIQKLRDERVERLAHRSVLVAGDDALPPRHFIQGPQAFGARQGSSHSHDSFHR
ncbi:UNVERIFIED_CONTAM: hypothetical protein HHA_230230 [Hammondia hammondi]|eukprot:XP_008889587.1 hypothetical protein HHA_230230 [Hammondia hammondi]